MSDVDECCANLRKFARVEQVMGTKPGDMAIACCDQIVTLFMVNGKTLDEAKSLLEIVWKQNTGRTALRLVEEGDEA